MDEHVISDASTLDVAWQRATATGSNGDCFEFAAYNGMVALRHSKAPNGPALIFTPRELECMLDGAVKGEFDHLTR